MYDSTVAIMACLLLLANTATWGALSPLYNSCWPLYAKAPLRQSFTTRAITEFSHGPSFENQSYGWRTTGQLIQLHWALANINTNKVKIVSNCREFKCWYLQLHQNRCSSYLIMIRYPRPPLAITLWIQGRWGRQYGATKVSWRWWPTLRITGQCTSPKTQ
jgi:hypothetical protein